MGVSPLGRAAGGGGLAAPPPLNTSAPLRAAGGSSVTLAATRQQLGEGSPTPHPPPPLPVARVTREEAFKVSVQTGMVYGQGLVCNEAYTHCREKDLLLDVYDPVAKDRTAPRPAMVLVHGGTEVNGGRVSDPNVLGTAEYFSRRGFVVFAVDYRLEGEHGLFPCPEEGCKCEEEENHKNWYRKPCYVYPAVRDYKAAIRFIRAHSLDFNVDDRLIVASGGSAGATNILVAALADEELYKSEFDLKQDPTLSSTNLEVSSNIRMAVLHWGFAQAVNEAIKAYGRDRFPFKSNTSLDSDLLPAVLHFHGPLDNFADFTKAKELANELQARGLHYELFTLNGCNHGAWCGSPFQDGRNCDSYITNASETVEQCVCKIACPMQDMYSLPAIVDQLSLELV